LNTRPSTSTSTRAPVNSGSSLIQAANDEQEVGVPPGDRSARAFEQARIFNLRILCLRVPTLSFIHNNL